MTDSAIMSAIQETSGLILRFKAAIEETKKKYADKPRYLALSVAQSQKQIQKLLDGVFKLLGVGPSDAFPLSFGILGDDNQEELVRIDSLKQYLQFFSKSLKEASLLVDPSLSSGDFLIRAASTGSMHISIEPSLKAGANGLKIIREIGNAFKEIESLKNSNLKHEISPLAQKVMKLIPRKKIHISKVEFRGSSFSTNTISFSRGEIKTRQQGGKRECTPLLPITGKIVAIDGEKRIASIGGESRIKFRYSQQQEGKVIAFFMQPSVKFVIQSHGDKKTLVEIDPG